MPAGCVSDEVNRERLVVDRTASAAAAAAAAMRSLAAEMRLRAGARTSAGAVASTMLDTFSTASAALPSDLRLREAQEKVLVVTRVGVSLAGQQFCLLLKMTVGQTPDEPPSQKVSRAVQERRGGYVSRGCVRGGFTRAAKQQRVATSMHWAVFVNQAGEVFQAAPRSHYLLGHFVLRVMHSFLPA